MGATARQAEGGPVTNVLSEEPPRPRPSQEQLEFFPALKLYVARMEWADVRIQELFEAKRHTETNNKKQQELQEDVLARVHTKEQHLNDKMEEAEDKLAHITRREEELKAREAGLKRTPHEISSEQELLDAIGNLGSSMEKSARDMSTLVASKNRPQQAFDQWAKKNLDPNLQFFKLNQRVKEIQQQNIQQKKDLEQREDGLAQRIAAFESDYSQRDAVREQELEATSTRREQELEATFKRRDEERQADLLRRTAEHKKAVEQLAADRLSFEKEQSEWRAQRAQELEGDELDAVQKLWLTVKEKDVMPGLRAQAKRECYNKATQDLEKKMEVSCAQAKEEGRKEGFSDGYSKGQAEATKDISTSTVATRQEGYNEGFARGLESRMNDYRDGYQKGLSDGKEQGRNAGHSQGHEKGYKKGYSAAEEEVRKDLNEAECRSVHLGARFRHVSHFAIMDPDGSPCRGHPYWWGREVAQRITELGL